MRMRWIRGCAVLVVLVVTLFSLAGCGTTPSVGSGVSLEIRVLGVTAYTARIQMTFANRSSATFYPMRYTGKGEECSLWSGTCATVEMSIPIDGNPLLPGEVRSVTGEVLIGNNYTRVRWIEIVIEGRLGSSWITVSSNRVYF
ncbi:MAG: hypothetical protein H5U36_01755 [Candidatus Caldatribacterium sp.]|nr:hypothetical protein [Candidatus Caldatribacterium sp.]